MFQVWAEFLHIFTVSLFFGGKKNYAKGLHIHANMMIFKVRKTYFNIYDWKRDRESHDDDWNEVFQ